MSKPGITERLDFNKALRVDNWQACKTSRPVILTKPQTRTARQDYPKKSQYMPERGKAEPSPLDSASKLTLDKSKYVALIYLSSQSAFPAIPLLPSPERANSVL